MPSARAAYLRMTCVADELEPVPMQQDIERPARLVGTFFYHFSRLEEAVERLLEAASSYERPHSLIMVKSMGLSVKISTAKALLQEASGSDGELYAAASMSLQRSHKLVARRNVAAHSAFDGSDTGGVVFRNLSKKTCAYERIYWSDDDFLRHFSDLQAFREEILRSTNFVDKQKDRLYLHDFHHHTDDPETWAREIEAIALKYGGGVYATNPGTDENDLSIVTAFSRHKILVERLIREYYGEDLLDEFLRDIREA